MYQEKLKIDWWVVAVWALLVIFGWMNIYSSTYSADSASIFDIHTYAGKQLLWIGITAVLAAVVLLTEPRLFVNGAYPFYALVLVMLVLTLVVAEEVNGARSWIKIGEFKFQASEFAKLATALALSKYMSAIDVEWSQTHTKLICLALMVLPAGLIMLQPDTGSVLVFLSFLLPLYREGLSGVILIIGVVAVALFVLTLVVNKYILIGALLLLAIGYLFIWLNKRSRRDYLRTVGIWVACVVFIFSVDIAFNKVLKPHQRERIDVLLGKVDDIRGSGYNVYQSKIAIGSGGIFGKGYLKGTLTKANFVPERHTDFIFCTIGEEWGWVGCILVLSAYGWLLFRLIAMAERQRSRFSRFYGYCVASILFIHLFVNIGMVMGLVPVIGIPLPFLSYGGSSLISFSLLLFIFIRLDATRNQLF